MFCRQCGAQNEQDAPRCLQCGAALQPLAGAPPTTPGTVYGTVNVQTYLAQAILATLFCCMPLGLVAIYHTGQVNGMIASSNYPMALETSRKARRWCWITFAVGLSGWLLYFLLYALIIAIVAIAESQR